MDAWSPDGMLEKLLYDLVAAPGAPTIMGAEPNAIDLVFPSGGRVLLLRYANESELQTRIRAAMKAGIPEIALIGGPVTAAKLFKAAKPMFMPSAVFCYHLPDQGPLWRSARSLVSSTFGKAISAPIKGAPNAEAFAQVMQQAAQQQRVVHKESSAFQRVLASRRPVATYALAASFALMFALEYFAGGTESTPVLVRLGALVPGRVAHEPWRLFSAAFLHIGLMHIALNTYVLIIIGSLLERVIGSWRMLVVFWLSVLAGNLVSLTASSAALTAGASGGVLGLLAAQSVLAYRPRGLLPQAMIPGARRAAVMNLVINIANSLRPGVSISAHLGGGIVGVALMLSPALSRGLPTLDEVTDDAPTRPDRLPAWVRPVAIVGIVAMATSLVAAVMLGGALRFMRAPTYAAKQIGKSGITMQIPEGLSSRDEDGKKIALEEKETAYGPLTHAIYGEILNDPIMFEVNATQLTTPLDDKNLPAELQSLKETFAKSPAGMVLVGQPTMQKIHGHDAVLVTLKSSKTDVITQERGALLTPTRLILVDVVYWNGQAQGPGSAQRALESVTGD